MATNIILKAHYTAMDPDNLVRIYWQGWHTSGDLELLRGFFPAPAANLKKLLRIFKEPLEAEYIPFCWMLYNEASEMSKCIGAAGKQSANMLMKNIDILAAELKIT